MQIQRQFLRKINEKYKNKQMRKEVPKKEKVKIRKILILLLVLLTHRRPHPTSTWPNPSLLHRDYSRGFESKKRRTVRI